MGEYEYDTHIYTQYIHNEHEKYSRIDFSSFWSRLKKLDALDYLLLY